MENYLQLQLERHNRIEGFQLCQFAPGYSMVFRYPDSTGDRVRKYIFEMHDDAREFLVGKAWYAHIGFEVEVGREGGYTTVDMPWLGYGLKDVVKFFQSGESEKIDFYGLSQDRASYLVSNTYSLLIDFEQRYDRVHTDFWVPGYDKPLNILFHPELDFFPFIDAESFALRNTSNVSHFNANFELFSNYVMNNLTID